jgi:ribosomal protein S18 acetylase RimI-like enzyme
MEYRLATPEDDDLVVAHYLAIWESYGTDPLHVRDDAKTIVRTFLKDGRQKRQLATFIAFDGEFPAGSVSCQLHLMPYPAVLKPERMSQGYIWSVWVDPAYRKRGISTELVTMAVDHLQEVGCTGVVLHASDAGQGVYRALGFEMAHEMRLAF